MDLEKLLKEKGKFTAGSKPLFFDLNSSSDQKKLQQLLAEDIIHHVIDDYQEQQHELFAIKNPTIVYTSDFKQRLDEYFLELQKNLPLHKQGKWVFFPWISTLVHILEADEFHLVRTARNRNLITKEEQERFYNAVVGIGGLSVGNSVALAIVLMGGARYLRLADNDRLALTNINRIRAGVDNLGLRKVDITARQIYLLNPYAEIEVFPKGLNPDNIEKFFNGPPKLDIVVDELDNIAIKYLIREQAKKYKIAVIMGADNGDNAIIDVERHDLDPKTPFFHRALGNITHKELTNLDKFGIGQTITKMLGAENVEIRMQQSLMEMGKTLVSWPQLGGAALLNGIAISYCVRKIINKQSLITDRAVLSMDEKLDPLYNTPAEKEKRLISADNFKKMFKI